MTCSVTLPLLLQPFKSDGPKGVVRSAIGRELRDTFQQPRIFVRGELGLRFVSLLASLLEAHRRVRPKGERLLLSCKTVGQLPCRRPVGSNQQIEATAIAELSRFETRLERAEVQGGKRISCHERACWYGSGTYVPVPQPYQQLPGTYWNA